MQTVSSNQNLTFGVQVMEGMVGGIYLLSAVAGAKNFICSFCPSSEEGSAPTTRSIWERRIFSLASSVGAAARFLDWGRDRGWFVVTFINTVALKIIAHFTGLIIYLMNAMETLGQIDEVERLSALSERFHIYQPGAFDTHMYALWLVYFSHITFWLYSGLQLASLVVGVAAVASVINYLLLAGVISIFGSIALQKIAGDQTRELGYLRSLAPPPSPAFTS